MIAHLRNFVGGSNHHHGADLFHFHPQVTPLEERCLLSGSPVVPGPAPPDPLTTVSPAASTGTSAVAVGDPSAVTTNGNQSNSGGSQTPASAPVSSASANPSTATPAGNATLAAQLQNTQSTNVLGAVPSANGVSSPIPAVVALFDVSPAQPGPTAPETPQATAAPMTRLAPPPMTGGDLPPAAATPNAPLSPALPPMNLNFPNDVRDQMMQEFSRPQPPPVINSKPLDNPLKQSSPPLDRSIPDLGPSLNDESLRLPADPSIGGMPADNSGWPIGLSVELAPAEVAAVQTTSTQTQSTQTKPVSAQWASVAAAATLAATIGGERIDPTSGKHRKIPGRSAWRMERTLRGNSQRRPF